MVRAGFVAMKQIRPLGDERVLAHCVYCGAHPDSRDHVPPRVMLDEPFPENLSVVPSCRRCNESFSLDEEYVAALLDCVAVGSAQPSEHHRDRIRSILERKPALVAALENARTVDPVSGSVAFGPDASRLTNVVVRLARGHAAFELHSAEYDDPLGVSVCPIGLLDEKALELFETLPSVSLYPEVGSRAMLRMSEHGVFSPSWIVVQPGRYRFLASPGPPLMVRIVIGEYLACEVVLRD